MPWQGRAIAVTDLRVEPGQGVAARFIAVREGERVASYRIVGLAERALRP